MLKFITYLLVLYLLLLSGCAAKNQQLAGKTFRYGTTAFGTSMGNAGIDPHQSYQGWSAVRYGVGETLFRLDEQLRPQPWLAENAEQLDERTYQITLRDNITFSSGRPLTAEAVKECLQELLSKQPRAAADLKISRLTAHGKKLIITTYEPAPALLNYLCDPYSSIMDMHSRSTNQKYLAGTGPFIVRSLTNDEILLQKNPHYWNGPVKMDNVLIKGIPDGNTLTMALQNGELDAAQGLPYNSLQLFEKNPAFKISSAATSRVFQAAFNYQVPLLQDDRVRQAIAMAIDKVQFCQVLLGGNGLPAAGPFPDTLAMGMHVQAAPYNPVQAKKLLQAAGWTDNNGNGYLEKDGQTLTLRWLTYPARQELPLLAEAAQAYLKAIGIKTEINITDNYAGFLQAGQWDIFANAFVSMPTGDPLYYFNTHAARTSSYNAGSYDNPAVQHLLAQLSRERNPISRQQTAQKLAQQINNDNAYLYFAHLKMSLVMRQNVHGLTAHPSDYYEITASLNKE